MSSLIIGDILSSSYQNQIAKNDVQNNETLEEENKIFFLCEIISHSISANASIDFINIKGELQHFNLDYWIFPHVFHFNHPICAKKVIFRNITGYRAFYMLTGEGIH